MMTTQDFIALADAVIDCNRKNDLTVFTRVQLDCLATFCRQQNPMFDRKRWLAYIGEKCTPNGGNDDQ